MKDDLLPGLVVGGIVVGVVLGRIVGDAHQGAGLRQGQLRRLLAEVVPGGRADAVLPAAKENDVQVPLQNFVLGVGGLQLQGAADLRQLPLDRDLIFTGQVFNELLGDGGPAEHRPARHRVEHRAGSPLPVHAVVFPEPLVFNGNERILELLGNLLSVNPDPILGAGQGIPLRILAGGGVPVIDGAGQVHGHCAQVNNHGAGIHNVIFYVLEEYFPEQEHSHHAGDDDGEQKEKQRFEESDDQRRGLDLIEVKRIFCAHCPRPLLWIVLQAFACILLYTERTDFSSGKPKPWTAAAAQASSSPRTAYNTSICAG